MQVTDWDVREDSITKRIKEATEGTAENTVRCSHHISVIYVNESI